METRGEQYARSHFRYCRACRVAADRTYRPPKRAMVAIMLPNKSGGYARGLSLVAVTVREDVCWAGAGSSGVAREVLAYEKYMEGSSGVDGGCMGPAMPVVCLSIPSAREDMAGGPRAVVPGTGESGAGVLLPAGLGSCTGLYVAVRGIGGEGADAHVIWRTALPGQTSLSGVYAGQRVCGGAGRSGL